MARHEEVPAWRAALIALLDPGLPNSSARQFLAESLEHENAQVRAAAIRALAPAPGSYSLLRTLRNDSNRLVRLDASWATLHPLHRDSANNAELMAYLDLNSDQPAGVARQAQLALTERRMDDAVRWIDKAADWDPSAGSYHLKGRVYHASGRLPEAETALRKAVDLDPRVADHHYALALLHAELERPHKALLALQETVKADPAFGRAWYNLGLGHAALEQLDEAIAALQKAELLMPDSPEAAYARATVHLRQNDLPHAREAINAALKIEPDFAPALQMLQAIER
jgi:tetratricopeptide (TPR) repeat protein